MTLAAGATTTYRVLARNTSTSSENRIHSDDVAAQFGFRGGLVPGVAVYAYMTAPVVEALGPDWHDRGSMSARFVQPFYEGDEVVATATVKTGDAGPLLDLAAARPGEEPCATGTAALPDSPTVGPDPSAYPEVPTPAPADRPAATVEVLSGLAGLSLPPASITPERLTAYRAGIGDTSPLYEDGSVVHPGYLIRFANAVLSTNVRLGPWIHVSSDVTNLRRVQAGDSVATRARVSDVFERKGHKFVTLDVLLVRDDEPVMHVNHTAIYEIARRVP